MNDEDYIDDEEGDESAQVQHKISPGERLKPWQFKPGQSGNPGGKPKGTLSLKEYARKYLMELPEDEKIAFMKGLNKDIIWKMAEGNPENKTDLTSGGKPILQISEEIAAKHGLIPTPPPTP
jgi:hypothetical protein